MLENYLKGRYAIALIRMDELENTLFHIFLLGGFSAPVRAFFVCGASTHPFCLQLRTHFWAVRALHLVTS